MKNHIKLQTDASARRRLAIAKTWQDRAIQERDALKLRIDNLVGFISSTEWKTVPPVEKIRLELQQKHMWNYHQILCERIQSNFGVPHPVMKREGLNVRAE